MMATAAIFILVTILPSHVFSQASVPAFLMTKANDMNIDMLLDVPARY
jgi:hypothetical protein